MLSEFKIEIIRKTSEIPKNEMKLFKRWAYIVNNIHYIYDCCSKLEYCIVYCKYNVGLLPGDSIQIFADNIKTGEIHEKYEAKVLEIKYWS